MVTPFTYFDLVDALSQPGCAICQLLRRDSERSLDALLYEYVNDPEVRAAFRARRGLCNEHSWELSRHTGNLLGIVLLYRGVIDEVLGAFRQELPEIPPAAGHRTAGRAGGLHKQAVQALIKALQPGKKCMICETLAAAERQYLEVFSEYVTDEKILGLYRQSDGLCLPHFRQILKITGATERLALLVSIQHGIWSRLYADLQEFIDKSDYRRISEEKGAEGDSWRRAIRGTAGEEGVFGKDG